MVPHTYYGDTILHGDNEFFEFLRYVPIALRQLTEGLSGGY